MKALLFLAGAALAAASPAAAQELVTNGSFESGNFSGFTQTGNTGHTGIAAFNVTAGAHSAYFGAVGSPGGISQSLATTAGQDYRISFDLLNQGGTPSFYQILFGTNVLFTATNPASFGFTNFSTTATATGASTTLAFSFRNDPAFFYLDNISVTAIRAAVPEPATWAMMLIGFGAIGAAMRRRVATQPVRLAKDVTKAALKSNTTQRYFRHVA